MPQQADQIARGEHRNAAGPACLWPLFGGTDQASARLAGVQRGDQHAGAGDHPAIQREFPHRDPVAQLFGIGHPHRRQQRQRNRQIVMRSVLGQIGGREVDRDPLRRQGQTHRRQRRLHPFAAFAHRLVGQADHGEARHAGGDLTLHLNAARLQPQIGNRLYQRDHVCAPHPVQDDCAGLRGACRAVQQGQHAGSWIAPQLLPNVRVSAQRELFGTDWLRFCKHKSW